MRSAIPLCEILQRCMPQVSLGAQVLHATDQARLDPLRSRPLHALGRRGRHLAAVIRDRGNLFKASLLGHHGPLLLRSNRTPTRIPKAPSLQTRPPLKMRRQGRCLKS